MRIVSLRWQPYRVPLITPFPTAHGQITHREGAIVRVDLEGATGLGELAPLPGFRGIGLAESLVELAAIAPDLLGLSLETGAATLTRQLDDRRASAASAALDAALSDAAARIRGEPLARFLSADAAKHIPVNATIGGCALDAAVDAARAAMRDGFACVKLKVGVERDLGAEIARVRAVRGALEAAIELRLDANGAWDADRAIATLRALRDCAVALVEQPCPADDLSGLARVRRAVNVPIAADESVGTLAEARAVIAARAADILIVKPSLVGGLSVARAIIVEAAVAGLTAIVTTALEAGVGTAAALHLAATLPRPITACGLATLPLLVDDLVRCGETLTPRGGVIALTGAPGIGVEVDEEALARYAAPGGGSVRGQA